MKYSFVFIYMANLGAIECVHSILIVVGLYIVLPAA